MFFNSPNRASLLSIIMVIFLTLICHFLIYQCGKSCNADVSGTLQKMSKKLIKVLDIMLFIHKLRKYPVMEVVLVLFLNDKYKRLFLNKINSAYKMSDGTKSYIVFIVSLFLLNLFTLLSTVYVDNKKYLMKSFRLAPQYRNLWNKTY